MATITITYVEPVVSCPVDAAAICATFKGNTSYADSDAYAGTVYDTNVWDGECACSSWENIVSYLSKIVGAPNVLILFKAAARDGQAAFEETDPKLIEYYTELGVALEPLGFTVTAA